jgi:hypothetical protein
MVSPMPGSVKGFVMGFANVAAVATFFAVMEPHRDWIAVFVLLFMFGAIPGIVFGGIVGHIAQEATLSRGVLLVMMIFLSCLAVATLGSLFDCQPMIVVSCIPTAACCSILERWTRPVPKIAPAHCV